MNPLRYLVNAIFPHPMQKQAENLQQETDKRARAVEGLQQIQSRFSTLMTEVASANERSAGLLQTLKSNHLSTDRKKNSSEAETLDLKTFSDLVAFIIELKKLESLKKLHPTIAALEAEVVHVETEAHELQAAVEALKQATAAMRALIIQKKEITQLAKKQLALRKSVIKNPTQEKP